MENTAEYCFRPATMADLPLLQLWRSHPHVAEWWGADAPYDADELADPRVNRWIVSHERRPFAYMQDYAVHGWGEHHFDYLPKEARGIDLFIGPSDMIGQGHGTAFIRQRMERLFDQGIPVLATDPHPDNHRAIAAYQKAGFHISGPPVHTRWGTILPMETRQMR